jgi:glycosyltransferase involved in cell wall biosynthesis
MKVLQIGLGNNPGGVESFAINYARELQKKGVVFDFLCMYGQIAYADEIERLGGRIFYVPNVKKNYFGYVKAVRRILKEQRYDVVHVNMLSAANIVPLRLAKEAGVHKVIAHSHNSSTTGLIRTVMHRLNQPAVRQYADTWFACGTQAAAFLFGEKHCAEQQIYIIKNAINVESYLFSEENRNALRKQLGYEGCFIVGHVGRFNVQKNHEGIIKIFLEVLKYEPKAVLCLVGDGELKNEIEQQTTAYGIRDRVYFAGVRNDVERLFSMMDVFLFPSLFEGLPFAVIEAQANGLPCVVSDTISDEVLLDHNITALPLQKEAAVWAKKILSFKGKKRTEPEKTKQLMEEAGFDIKIEAEALKQLYQE